MKQELECVEHFMSGDKHHDDGSTSGDSPLADETDNTATADKAALGTVFATVDERIEYLRGAKPTHWSLLEKILSADDGKVFHVDLVLIAAMHRSLSLIDGFTLLVGQKNALAAVPLVRMQIDNIIRLYACWLVNEPPVVANALLQDQPLNRLKSRSGKPLTDKFLYEAAAEHYPWIPDVYKQTSGFVHLSGRHIFAPVSSANKQTHTLTISVGGGRDWAEHEMLESINAFIEATRCLLHLCGSWLFTKEQGQMSPAERAKLMGVPLPEEFRP